MRVGDTAVLVFSKNIQRGTVG